MSAIEGIIGREAQVNALREALDRARRGRGGMMVVSGESGVGKTRLCEALIAYGGLRAATGRAREVGTPPYGPLAAALRAVLRRDEAAAIDPGLAGYLGVVLPEHGPPADSVDDDGVAEAVSGVLHAAAREQPVVVFLDDLHWADDATLDLLPLLAERLRGGPVLLLCTYRSENIPRGHGLRRMRNELRRAHLLEEVTLEPFGAEETASLLATELGAVPSPALVSEVQTRSGGLPLFIQEIAAILAARSLLRTGDEGLELDAGVDIPLPESIRDAVLLRLDGLSPRARELLEAASAIGTDFDIDVVLDTESDAATMDTLFSAGLLRETAPGRGSFAHALTRDAVYADIPWSRRRSINARVAERLRAAGAPLEVIAEHRLRANQLDEARSVLVEAADRSCRLHAYRDASRSANRALEIWPQGEDEEERAAVLERLAHCAQVSGQLAHTVRALLELLDSPFVRDDAARRAATLRSLANAYHLQGAWERSVESRRLSVDAFVAAGNTGEAAAEALTAAAHHQGLVQYHATLEMGKHALELAEAAGRTDIRARALSITGATRAMLGHTDDGEQSVQQGLSLALENNNVEAAADAYRRLGNVLEYSSQFRDARRAYFTAMDFCRAQGSEIQFHCMGCLSWVLFRLGDYRRAMEICREGTDESMPDGTRTTAAGVMGLIRTVRGEYRPARKYVRESLEIARRRGYRLVEMLFQHPLALLAELEGDGRTASRIYHGMIDLWERTDDHHDMAPAFCNAATFFARRGDDRGVTRVAEALTRITSSSSDLDAGASLAFVLGESSLVAGNPAEAAERFAHAREQFDALETPLESAWALWRGGNARASAGDRDGAVDFVSQAYRIYRNLGARPFAALTSGELEAMGERVESGRDGDAGADRRGGLTRRQLDVARLLAEGLTNKEIADRLYVSTRTVDMHVSNILDRLDCRSRAEAVRKAGTLGLL